MIDAPALEALLARVEAATGADREIDADLHLALGQEPNEHYREPWRKPILLAPEHQRPGVLEYVEISGVSARAAPHYTASLDAAIALCERVLPGWGWSVTCSDGYKPEATLYGRAPECRVSHVKAATPALALLAALLRAKIAEEEK